MPKLDRYLFGEFAQSTFAALVVLPVSYLPLGTGTVQVKRSRL